MTGQANRIRPSIYCRPFTACMRVLISLALLSALSLVAAGQSKTVLTIYAEERPQAAGLVQEILGGKKLSQADVPGALPSRYGFDWKQLQRWHTPEKSLPSGSIVLYREFSAWQRFKQYIIAAIFVVLAETLLIFGLLWQRAARRKVKADLILAHVRLRSAMVAGKAVGWEWDLKTGRDSWFGDLKTMFGIPSDTYVGRPEDFFRYVHPEDRQQVSEAVAEAKKNHTPYAAEFRVVWPDGTLRWVAASGKFYYSPKGEPERMSGMAVDITDRKRAAEALRESEERFRLVADTAPALIWMSGTDKLCTFFNKGWLNFTGRSIDLELGNGWAEGVHSEDLQRCLDTYVRAFDAREKFTMQYRLRRYDGEYRWVLDIGVPRFNQDGSFAGFIGSCVDVTDRKLAEEAVSSVNRRLIEAHEQERTRIGRELHDDIGQRLALLTIELEQHRQDSPDLPTEVRKRFGEIQKQTAEIATDVQSMSHELHSSKLEYLGIVTAISGFCKEFSEQQKVEVVFAHDELPRTLPPEISLCLFRMLQEALQNAVKHSGVRSFDVELRYASDAIDLTVGDSGSGFDVQEAMKTHGLGLISMAERLKLVDGQLSIESQPQRGTTIHARVPLRKAARARV